MRSLLEVLGGHLGQRNFNDSEWTDLLEVAEEENVLSWVSERLRHQENAQTAEQRKRLNEIQRAAQISTFVWIETLKSILSAFHVAGLPVVSLKGPCLAERFYGDASLRTSYDLDLLVRKSDLTGAERVLTGLGFIPHRQPDDYHQSWSRKGIDVELHHDVENPLAFEFGVDAAWDRAQLSQFHGVSVWLLAPSDELLFLCLHAIRHRFERLCLLLDLELAFRSIGLSYSRMLERRGREFDNVLVLGWMMAARLDPVIPPPQGVQVSPQERRRLEHLADRLWQERMIAPAPVLDWAAQHRFYLEVETPGWQRSLRRWRHWHILLTRLIDADFEFAERFRLRRNWQVRLLRPVRLIIKMITASPRTQ